MVSASDAAPSISPDSRSSRLSSSLVIKLSFAVFPFTLTICVSLSPAASTAVLIIHPATARYAPLLVGGTAAVTIIHSAPARHETLAVRRGAPIAVVDRLFAYYIALLVGHTAVSVAVVNGWCAHNKPLSAGRLMRHDLDFELVSALVATALMSLSKASAG